VAPVTEQLFYTAELDSLFEAVAAASKTSAEDVATVVVQTIGEEVARLARAKAPRATGELQRSIKAVHHQGYTRVVATAPHAAYVEFGTWQHNLLAPKSGTYEIRAKNAKALRFTGKDGRTVFVKKVEHPGIKAQPFLGPAYEEVLGAFTQGIGNIGVSLLLVEA
jgi:hypothetical protein